MKFAHVIGVGLLAVFWAVDGQSKPLLASSQDTYATACVDYYDAPERMVQLCSLALDDAGSSLRQQLEIVDKLAWAYSDSGKESKASDVFLEMLELDEESYDALDGLGWIAYDGGEYDRSADYFEWAFRQTPSSRVLAGLAASQIRSKRVNLEEGLKRMEAALAIDPENDWALREKAWLHLKFGGSTDEAESAFQQALGQNPRDKYALYGMEYILTEADRWEEALPYAQRALDVDPKYLAALSRRSLTYLHLDRPKLALKDGEALIAALPDDSDGYVRAARAMNDLGRRGQAIVLLANANSQIGYDSYLIYWYAKMLFFEGHYLQAALQVNRVVENEDADYYDYSLLTRAYIGMRDFKQARRAVDHTLALAKGDKWARFYNARILLAEGHFDGAEAEFDAAFAAGLPELKLKSFLSYLVAEGRYVQAIKMRVRYSDMQK